MVDTGGPEKIHVFDQKLTKIRVSASKPWGQVPRLYNLSVKFKLVRETIPDKKKKRTTTIFPFRSPFKTIMLIVIKKSFLIKSYENLSVT